MNKLSLKLIGLLALFATITAMVAKPRVIEQPIAQIRQTSAASGGDATTKRKTNTAFASPVPKLLAQERRIFAVGDHLFNTNWTTSPSSVPTKDGLGPLFNRVSCSSCHMRDGRGRPPLDGETFLMSKLIRISLPDGSPHPVYGHQLQEFGNPGVPAEVNTKITWEYITDSFADGTEYQLRKPVYEFTNLGYGPLGEILISPRVAPAVFGLGLLEAIPEEAILANVRETGDITGRPNYVTNVETGEKELGRFGWKANQPTLKQQDASAFAGDIGITSNLFPTPNCTPTQKECLKEAKYGDQPELTNKQLHQVTRYLKLLAVPQRRNMDDPAVKRGEDIFFKAQCSTCHIPTIQTGEHDIAQLSNQTIHPYTDLLLHDMGEGLADNRPDGEATGQEWRTPPLWGVGLQQVVNNHTNFLHDGRARNLLEAVLWHGGEASAARDYVKQLSKQERDDLVAFLNSL